MGQSKPFERLSEATLVQMSNRWKGAERGPYLVVADVEKLKDNWMVANTGTGADGREIYLTTDRVHVSELCSTAETQAEFFAHAPNDVRTLGQALDAAYTEIDRLTGQRIWQRWWEPRKRLLVRRWNEWWRKIKLNPFGHDTAVRWWIANQMQKRSDTCWANLVMWVMHQDFRDVLEFFPSSQWYSGVQSCRRDARNSGTCYCGKFATKKGAEYCGASFIVTNEIEPEDAPDLASITFPG